MENLLIIDTETTGLNHEKDKIIEIAGIFYNIPSRCIINQFSTILPHNENPCEHINKIPEYALKVDNTNFYKFISLLMNMLNHVDALVAHNSEFDRKFLAKENDGILENRKWICTKNDFKWPIPKGSSLSLINIALELGVPVVSAHRALTDCQLLASCFSKLDDLESRLEDACKERFLYWAVISFDKNHLAKEEGFSWSPENKRWQKFMTEEEAEEIKFSIKKV